LADFLFYFVLIFVIVVRNCNWASFTFEQILWRAEQCKCFKSGSVSFLALHLSHVVKVGEYQGMGDGVRVQLQTRPQVQKKREVGED